MKQQLKYIMGALMMAALFILSSCESEKTEKETTATEKIQTYTCPMHPQIVSDKPGNCPICGMELVSFDKSNASDTLMLSELQQALANVTVDTVKTGSFSAAKNLNGRLVVNPAQSEFISSRVAGRIEVLYVRETGAQVRKGQPLYKIYSEELSALQQEYLLTVAQAAQFPEDAKFRQLANAAKQKLSLYHQSEGQIQQLLQTKKVNPLITYPSPASGVVSELFVTEGQYVGEGSSIMSLEGYSNLWVEADIYPAEASLVKKGDKVKVIVAGFENEPQTMTVDFIAPSLQPGNQLITIRGSIPNTGNQFQAGMQAGVELPVSQTSAAINVPVEAVIHEQQGDHVWVQAGMGKFIPRMVETSNANYDRIEITKGLSVGDLVVVSGAYLLYSEFKLKKGKDPMAGHQH